MLTKNTKPAPRAQARAITITRKPLARAVALILAVGATGQVDAGARPFSSEWFNGARSAASAARAGAPAPGTPPPLAQQQRSREHLQRSINNLGRTAAAVAAQKAAQDAARRAAREMASNIPDGLTEGGLKVDVNPDTAGWLNAEDPTQTVEGNHTTVSIKQNADKAILNWETFNVGRDTTVDFDQQANWAALNRVNDPNARPSQIQGQIQGDGTVMIVNRNGVVFSGTSQVNVRNLVAAAADIGDEQFTERGLYVDTNGSQPTFTDAAGDVAVDAGARITTHEPQSVTQGGGYALLLGRNVDNAGTITTRRGQTTLAAGETFYIRKGVGTEANTASTTRGNEVASTWTGASSAGTATNRGLIVSREGDITLTGHDVRQEGVAMATTTINTRGTVHLLNSASDATGTVTLGEGATTAVVIEDDGDTATDSQREQLIEDSQELDGLRDDMITGAFDNLALLSDRRDQSRVEIVSGRDVVFEDGSLTLATGGQIAVDAGRRAHLAAGSELDVSGSVGVKVTMESNNVRIDVQGNDLRDSPDNRDGGDLFNSDVWVDRRDLIHVPAGTGGEDTGERWYTAGGLLEVGGYLDTQGHGIGEWSATGGTVLLGGAEVVSQQGSVVNLSGGTLDVETGYVHQTYLKGADGNLYDATTASGAMRYTGIYQGYERVSERWDQTDAWRNPLIAPGKVLENGYTVGRDAGRLIISAPSGVMEGEIVAKVYNGDRQTRAADGGLDGYQQAQNRVARPGGLAVGQYGQYGLEGALDSDIRIGDIEDVADQLALEDDLGDRLNTLWLDADRLNQQNLGLLDLVSSRQITVEKDLTLAEGGSARFVSGQVNVDVAVTARGGDITLTNTSALDVDSGSVVLTDGDGHSDLRLGENGVLDVRGLWHNALLEAGDTWKRAYVDGGDVSIDGTRDVTLAEGSLIDVSSGAALLENGALDGGRGGNVSLRANVYQSGLADSGGRLLLGAEVRGYGVDGGGTLTVETGQGILVGQGLRESGLLQAGEQAPTDLTLVEDLVIPAGATLPFDYTYERNAILPGEAVGDEQIVVSSDNPLVPAAAWTIPADAPAGFFVQGSPALPWLPAPQYGPGDTVPAGTSLVGMSADAGLPANYIVPADAFPQGLPIPAQTATYLAGSTAPTDLVVLEAGEMLAEGMQLDTDVRVEEFLTVDPALFQRGFSHYEVNGHDGLTVQDGTQIDVLMPVYRQGAGGRQASNLEDGLALWTPPLHLSDPLERTFQQRGGASLTLKASRRDTEAESVTIGSGAELTVDPGETMEVIGGRQITVDGTLRAPGGNIHILNPLTTGVEEGGSIWIGEDAVLDAAGRAYVAAGINGQSYGEVLSGGRIVLGSPGSASVDSVHNLYDINNLFVIVRDGAVIDISGTRSELDLGQSQPTTVASDGGSLEMRSKSGIVFDGTLRAQAGGRGASGGALDIMLETMSFSTTTPDQLYTVPRIITLSQDDAGAALPVDLAPGQGDDSLVFGEARFAVDDLTDSGVDHLSLWSRDAILFTGDTRLDLGGSLSLTAATLAASPETPDINVDLIAPYVQLGGRTEDPLFDTYSELIAFLEYDQTVPLSTLTGDESRLTVSADLIDLGEGELTFGAHGTYDVKGGIFGSQTESLDLPGFARVDFDSQGDIRLNNASIATGQEFNFIAERVYATTHSDNAIQVGLGPEGRNGDPLEGAVLRFQRRGTGRPDTPLSVFGSISLQAPRIEQGGALFAPLGAIIMGSGNFSNLAFPYVPSIGPVPYFSNVLTDVVLQEGSITSVSAADLVLPYGYTVDGLDYYYNGEKVGYNVSTSNGDDQDDRMRGGIRFDAGTLVAEEGAVLDVSAGGELRGQGFASGRGGSVDILNTALANAAPWHAGNADARVYAIVPGLADSQAPLDPALVNHSDVGQQITIGEGVAGLPAGTYTLLPAEYALMPGGYRVELGGGAARYDVGVTADQAAGLYQAPVTLSNGLSGFSSGVPLWASVMAGDTVRRYADYNETTLSQWVADRKAEFGDPGLMVPLVPEDVRAVEFNFGDADPAADQVFRFEGELRNTQMEGGRGGMVLFNGADYEVVAEGGASAADRVSLVDADLNALGATLLSLGTNQIDESGALTASGTTVVRSGATLKAGAVILGGQHASGDGVVVESGATLDTRGQEAAGWTGENGFLIQPQSGGNAAFLVVSNDLMQFGAAESQGSVRIEDGAALHSEGTVALLAPGGIDIGDIDLSARDFLISMEDINIGTDEALARAEAQGVLSDGWQLNQNILDGLLGLGELESFSLQTAKSINFFGPVTLDTYAPDTGESRAALRFISPAIYGLGGDGDTATIRTDQFIWSGLGYTSGREGAPDWEVGSVAPGDVIAGGAGTGSGGFMVDANEVVFGFNGLVGDQTANATLERLMLGFGDVTFQAKERITSELYGGLSVYQQKNSDDTFSGGNLTLSAPVLTGRAGSEMAYRAGDRLLVSRPDNAATVDPADLDLGAQLSLEGNNVRVEGSIIAPSGKVAIESTDDLILADGSLINVAGRAVDFFDVTRYSFGGAVSLDSAEGNIQQAAGSRIDVSAPHGDAGKLEATAVNGTVDLAGELVARDPEADPEGEGGTIRIKANTLPGFVALNQRLTEGGFDYLRGFETNEGDLTLGEEVRARHIEATANGGDLIVDGNLRAGGEYAGSIYLAAANDLRVQNGATLDASGERLKLDSYGDPIEGSNRAIINLTSRDGRLVLGDNVTLDVGAGGEARGSIDLNARRLGEPGETSATGNDVAVDAGNNLTVNGTKRLSVNGFWTYDDAPDDTDPEHGNTQVINQDYLDGIDAQSTAFITAARANDALQTRLASLKAAAGDAFSLRPGVEIVSKTEDGNLRIDGDVDFSGYRYGPNVDAAVHGSGTAGVFVMRAGGDLEVNGSVTDGFDLPPSTPDSIYTLDFELSPELLDGRGRLVDDFVAPENLTLRGGWALGSASSLPFDLDVTRTFTVEGNIEVPIDIEVAEGGQGLVLGGTLEGRVWLPEDTDDIGGNTHPAGWMESGTVIATGIIFPPGTIITAGSKLNIASFDASPALIPAGTPLNGFTIPGNAEVFNQPVILEVGDVLPKGLQISSFEGGEKVEQQIWPMASPLQEGSESWSLRFVAGADLSSASSRTTRMLPDQGDLILDHPYLVSTSGGVDEATQGLSVIRTGSGDLELVAGRDYVQESRFSIYTAGTAVEGSPALGAERAGDGSVLGGDHAAYEDAAAAANALINAGGGNVLLKAGRDIRGYESNGETDHWLWAASDTETANQQVWGINTGNYGLVGSGNNQYLDLLGFDGIGTLGGGNLTVTAGGDAGADTRRTSDGQTLGGIFLMVGAAGWVDGDGRRHTYGGGDLKLDLAGTLDPVFLADSLGQGGVANLRGDVQVRARALGDLWQTYDVNESNTDPRPDRELLRVNKDIFGGLRLLLGDARASVYSLGDALLNVQDPSRNGVALQTDRTEVALVSAGGDIGVGTRAGGGSLPARFSVMAAGGSVYGNANSASGNTDSLIADVSSDGWLEFLAADAIYDLGLSTVYDASLSGREVTPARFYAREGDIYQLYYGYYGERGNSGVLENIAGRPAHVRAGRDIVEYGGGTLGLAESGLGHYSPTDVSLIQAGRDLIHINTKVVGPGTLELIAGRSVYQGSRGWIRSVGPFSGAPTDDGNSGGADIVVNAGMGAAGPDYQAVIDAYLNPDNLADPDRPLGDQPGKVARTYQQELENWLVARYGAEALEGGEPLAYFQALAPEQQRVFLRDVYYTELREGGREFNDPDGDRYGSYLRSRRMIETLLPQMDSEAGTSGYQGDYTMFSSASRSGLLRTEGGGDIQMLVPGGDLIIGLDGVRPENGDNGILTQGRGDIQLFSQGDIALGLSRIFTTYGGDIFAWSNAGDINAGRGAASTLVYTPPRRVYDAVGNVTLSPSTPTTGAGIATLAPIAEVPPGDVDLIAPLGVIDAGEAGIRVSGNVNVAALQVVNADNIDVQGESTGLPAVAAVNVGALTNASSAASSAVQAAEQVGRRYRQQPSVINVEIIGYGEERLEMGGDRSGAVTPPSAASDMVRVVGAGPLSADQKRGLTEAERRGLKSR